METTPHTTSTRRYDVASGIVAFLALYHGLVPLLVRLLFDADQRFAPALWLPAPWWWIASLAIVLIAFALLVGINTAKERHVPPRQPPVDTPQEPEPADTAEDEGAGAYDVLSGFVFLVGLYNGVAPFIARLVFDGNLLLALPLRLPSPWWWLTSLGVLAGTVAALAAIDRARRHRFPDLDGEGVPVSAYLPDDDVADDDVAEPLDPDVGSGAGQDATRFPEDRP